MRARARELPCCESASAVGSAGVARSPGSTSAGVLAPALRAAALAHTQAPVSSCSLHAGDCMVGVCGWAGCKDSDSMRWRRDFQLFKEPPSPASLYAPAPLCLCWAGQLCGPVHAPRSSASTPGSRYGFSPRMSRQSPEAMQTWRLERRVGLWERGTVATWSMPAGGCQSQLHSGQYQVPSGMLSSPTQ